MTDPRKNGGGWIGVDLDGTLASYEGPKGEHDIGPPIEPMVRKVRKWIREGRDVRLMTARDPHPAIRRWMKEHLGKVLPITHTKDRFMQVLYDDRAVQVKRNTGEVRADDEEQVWRKS